MKIFSLILITVMSCFFTSNVFATSFNCNQIFSKSKAKKQTQVRESKKGTRAKIVSKESTTKSTDLFLDKSARVITDLFARGRASDLISKGLVKFYDDIRIDLTTGEVSFLNEINDPSVWKMEAKPNRAVVHYDDKGIPYAVVYAGLKGPIHSKQMFGTYSDNVGILNIILLKYGKAQFLRSDSLFAPSSNFKSLLVQGRYFNEGDNRPFYAGQSGILEFKNLAQMNPGGARGGFMDFIGGLVFNYDKDGNFTSITRNVATPSSGMVVSAKETDGMIEEVHGNYSISHTDNALIISGYDRSGMDFFWQFSHIIADVKSRFENLKSVSEASEKGKPVFLPKNIGSLSEAERDAIGLSKNVASKSGKQDIKKIINTDTYKSLYEGALLMAIIADYKPVDAGKSPVVPNTMLELKNDNSGFVFHKIFKVDGGFASEVILDYKWTKTNKQLRSFWTVEKKVVAIKDIKKAPEVSIENFELEFDHQPVKTGRPNQTVIHSIKNLTTGEYFQNTGYESYRSAISDEFTDLLRKVELGMDYRGEGTWANFDFTDTLVGPEINSILFGSAIEKISLGANLRHLDLVRPEQRSELNIYLKHSNSYTGTYEFDPRTEGRLDVLDSSQVPSQDLFKQGYISVDHRYVRSKKTERVAQRLMKKFSSSQIVDILRNRKSVDLIGKDVWFLVGNENKVNIAALWIMRQFPDIKILEKSIADSAQLEAAISALSANGFWMIPKPIAISHNDIKLILQEKADREILEFINPINPTSSVVRRILLEQYPELLTEMNENNGVLKEDRAILPNREITMH